MKSRASIAEILVGIILAGSLTSCMGIDFGSLADRATEDVIATVTAEDTSATTEAVTETTASSEVETTASTEDERDIRTLTITATGDCSLGALQTHEYGGSFHSYYDKYGEGYFMENFKEIFEADDFTVANMECALSDRYYDPEADPEKEYYIVGHPAYARILSESGVEACSLGNNHTRDVGDGGLEDTKQACDDAGLVWAYNDITGIYETEDGYRIGFVSTNLSGSVERENYVRQAIEDFRSQDMDLIVACCHWGIERENYPTQYQINLAHEFIDLGADVIIGNHPHVIQGVEYYHGKVICYSLGNFSFGANRNPGDKDTYVYQQTFTYIDGELQPDLDAHIIPACVSSTPEYNNFQPIPVEGDKKERIIQRMNTYSAPYSSVHFDSDGDLLIEEEQERS